MYTVTIMDRDDAGILSVTLLDLLNLIVPVLGQLEWSVSGLEALGAGAEELYRMEERHQRMSTPELENIAGMLDQVIDGEFTAYENGAGEPVLRLRSVDSSSWDVSTNQDKVLERVRGAFGSIYEAGDVG